MSLKDLIVLFCCIALASCLKHRCLRQLNKSTKTAQRFYLSLAADTIQAMDDDQFEIGHKKTEMNSKTYTKMISMTTDERKNTALSMYYASLAECKRKDIDCNLCDLVFIAHQIATADKHCYFICSMELASDKADELPTDDTFKTFVDSGMGMKDHAKTDKEYKDLVKKGLSEATGVDVRKKGWPALAALLIGAMVVKFVVFAGSAVLIGYITDNDRKFRDEPSSLMSQFSVKVIRPLAQVFNKITQGGCFVDEAILKVYLEPEVIIAKHLKDVKVGDMVESIDEVSGRQTFSRVYYIGHSDGKEKSILLNVFYNDGRNGIKTLGLSRRHLIYASKGNLTNAPLTQPIRADAVNKGDHVWVMESGQLVAKEVVDIIPFVGGVRHPLTENHHIVVDGVHASVHVLNENLYRGMTAPLRFTYWLNPEWNKGGLVNKLVRFVESVKEPMFNDNLMKFLGHFSFNVATVM